MWITNNGLVQVVRDLNPLSMWLKVRFLILVSGKNPVWSGKPNLSAPHVFSETSHRYMMVETSYKYHGNQQKYE